MTSDEQNKLVFWLDGIFKKDGFSDLHYDFPNYDTTGGYSANVIFVSIKAHKNNKKKEFEIFVKESRDKDIILNDDQLKLVYSTEINFYSKVVPYYKKFALERNTSPFNNIPHCFGTISDNNKYILFLENLKPKGFKINDLERLIDLDQAKLVLQAYGRWHAFSLACKDQEPEMFKHYYELMSPSKAESMCELFICSMLKEIEVAIDLFREKNCLEIMKRLEFLKEEYPKMFRDCFFNKNEDFLVVRHADCWNNNFLFHYDDQSRADQAILIDWQISFIGSPLADVTQFLLYSCHKETLEKIDDLLRFYYQSLSEKLLELGSNPKKCLPWNTCQKSFKKYVQLAVGGVPLNIRFRHKTDPDEQNLAQHVNDGSFNVWCGNEIRNSEEYFETMKEILELCIERNFM
ncbi:uncharacterized protein LOC123675743 [Harmonia axyridis]|uniref:uncharacterized protein LOC123675743 n=1 Tax=Harmonia axyridis TaxID=115357 RepID=UPI001E279512|nr:uncharacterized protein LOC123675743 [Harmonia axyridis]